MRSSRSADGARIFRRLLLACLLAVPALLSAQADLDDQVRSLAAQLRCPVCQNLSVSDSPSEMAQEMRGVIREQLQAGKTPEEVKAYTGTIEFVVAGAPRQSKKVPVRGRGSHRVNRKKRPP